MANRFKSKIYENCKMLAPDNSLIALVNKKKADWYISNNLADLIQDDENGLTFKLRFIPKQINQHDFCKELKDNLCVVCGETKDLTRHHIVPTCFRKHLPKEYIRITFYDIVPLCYNCHTSYEKIAQSYKDQLFLLNGIDINIPRHIRDKEYIASYAKTILKFGHSIPEDDMKRLNQFVEQHIKQYGGTIEEIAMNGKKNSRKEARKYIEDNYKKLIDNFGNFNEFIIHWRKHFIKEMKPQYMPKTWEIEKDITKPVLLF